MKVVQKLLTLPRVEYYKKHLLLINYILPVQMTAKEAEVLAHFMSLTGDMRLDPFCTSGRKIVKEKMGISSGGLGNYLDQLEKKEFIHEENNKLHLAPILIPEDKVQCYQFKLIMQDE